MNMNTSISTSVLSEVGSTVVEGESQKLGGGWQLLLVNVLLAPGTVLQASNLGKLTGN